MSGSQTTRIAFHTKQREKRIESLKSVLWQLKKLNLISLNDNFNRHKVSSFNTLNSAREFYFNFCFYDAMKSSVFGYTETRTRRVNAGLSHQWWSANEVKCIFSLHLTGEVESGEWENAIKKIVRVFRELQSHPSSAFDRSKRYNLVVFGI